ncbi:hypothetical protein [Rhodoflexus caldus]|uniref:hypothetical protein n=1 Tax=Rhodoflexus caldus TaxID=2891236 RepID=UPI00202ABD73|nr:hypothetical protein [Rhodoflexus caldus]
MKNILSVFAIVFALLSMSASANDKKPAASANNPQPEKKTTISALQAMQDEFLAEVQSYVRETFEVPAREVSKLGKPQNEVRVYDMAGNLVYCCKTGEYADLPSGAELLTVHGNIAYYMLTK